MRLSGGDGSVVGVGGGRVLVRRRHRLLAVDFGSCWERLCVCMYECINNGFWWLDCVGDVFVWKAYFYLQIGFWISVWEYTSSKWFGCGLNLIVLTPAKYLLPWFLAF
jgi:hypothetical protein